MGKVVEQMFNWQYDFIEQKNQKKLCPPWILLLSHFSACTLSCLSHVQLFAALWTIAHQALLSMGFSRQEYWSGLLCPPSRDLPEPGIKHESPALQADSLMLNHSLGQILHLLYFSFFL